MNYKDRYERMQVCLDKVKAEISILTGQLAELQMLIKFRPMTARDVKDYIHVVQRLRILIGRVNRLELILNKIS